MSFILVPGSGPEATAPSPERHRGRGRRFRIVALGLAGLSLGLAGCSSTQVAASGEVATLADAGDGTPGTTMADGGSNEEKLRRYAQCMRDNGVATFPDPVVGADGQVQGGGFRSRDGATAGFDPQSAEFQTANETCRQYREGVTFGGNRNVDRAKLQDAALKYAQCLRGEGLTVTDPDLTRGPGGGAGQGGAGQGATGPGAGAPPAGDGQGGRGGRGADFLARAMGLDPADPAVVAAQAKCQPAFQQAMQDAGAGAPSAGAAPASPTP